MNEEEKKESIEIESNEKKRSAMDPRKGQAYQDASEWEKNIIETRTKAEENKEQKTRVEKNDENRGTH